MGQRLRSLNGRPHPMFAGVAVVAVLVVGLSSTVASAASILPAEVLASLSNSCFVGNARDATCATATSFARDWTLAGAGQDAQIMATGRVTTNPSCAGAYYLTNTIVSTLNQATFNATYRPWRLGVAIAPSAEPVPTGLFAYDITSTGTTTYDAYAFVAALYRYQIENHDAVAAGRVAPVYNLTLNPSPRLGPGTMPLPAGTAPHWAPPVGAVSTMKRPLTVFDASDLAVKQDVAPADGWQDATAGHGTFIRGLGTSAFPGRAVPLVDITEFDSLATEGSIVTTIESYAFARRAVANLSAGTYACDVTTRLGVVSLPPLLLAHLVGWLQAREVHLVTAAGNDASTREFYPAAFGVRATPEYRPVCPGATSPLTALCLVDRSRTVTSVGSLVTLANALASYLVPSVGARSPFSNYGDWVEAWADGSDIVSDYPNAAYSYCVPTTAPSTCLGLGGTTTVPSGSAPSSHLNALTVWSGTSFAAPQVAIWIAAGNPAP